MKLTVAMAIVLMAVAAPAHAQVNPALAGNWTLTQNDAAGRGGRGGGIPGVPLATEISIKVSPTEVTVNTNTGSAQIGRASCRERVEISVAAVALKKKNVQI